MTIVWLLPNLNIGGGVRAAVELGSQLTKRNHIVYLVIPKGRKKIKIYDGLNIIECGLKSKNPILAVLFGLTFMIFKIPKCDIIIGSMPPFAILSKVIGWFKQIPSVNYVLNDDVNFFNDKTYIKSDVLLRIYRFFARLSIRHTKIITNSHWTATRVVSEGGAKPFAIVPSGYNPNIFKPQNSLINKHQDTVLMTIGRKVRWKGLSDLIQALNLIDKEKFPFRLLIVTQEDLDTVDAKFAYEIIKPVNDEELVSLYHRGDIYIHPSWFEGFGLPPLEAMACGIAVISTDCGGVREFLTDGVNALIVPPREPRTLARAIEKLIENPDLRNRLVENGLKVAPDWTWERIADKFENALNEIRYTY